jgi:PAP2 superfamily
MRIKPVLAADFPVQTARPHAPLLAATLALLLLDALWCIVGHWIIPLRSVMLAALGSLGLLAPLLVRRYRRDLAVRTALLCCASFIWFSLTMAVFSYLVVSTNAPLIDAHLARLDQHLGFDWPAVFLWTRRHPGFDLILALAYASAIGQIGAVIIYLAIANRREQLAEFTTVFVVTAVLTVIVSGFFPAEGPFKFYSALHADASMLSHFEPLREGTLRTIDPLTTQGLVSIPSFHTVVALLLAYAMRRTYVWPLFVVLSVLVILSTPVRGGHYLVDLVAGALMLGAVLAVRKAAKALLVRRRGGIRYVFGAGSGLEPHR